LEMQLVRQWDRARKWSKGLELGAGAWSLKLEPGAEARSWSKKLELGARSSAKSWRWELELGAEARTG